MDIINTIKYIFDKPQVDFSALYRKTDTDYEIVGDTTEILDKIPRARNTFNGVQYHQPDVSSVSCTVHGAATALSSLTGITFTLEQRKAIWNAMKEDGTGGESFGGYVDSAVKKWADWWNTQFPNDKVEYARVYMGTTQMYSLLEKGYAIDMSYRAMEGYQKDWAYDSIVNQQWDSDADLEEYGENSGMGHCLALTQSDIYAVKGSNIINVDNYVESENRKDNNIYGIDISVINRLTDNNKRVWSHWGYVYYFKNDFDNANVQVDRKLLKRLENRVLYNKEADKFAIVKNGKTHILNGKNISELFAFKWGSSNESYVLGLDKFNFKKIIN